MHYYNENDPKAAGWLRELIRAGLIPEGTIDERSIGGSWPPGSNQVSRIPVLANGLPGVMGRCRGYGNAIVPQVGAEFIKAFLNTQ